jgi:Zn-dependent peptidase ImmA (M78 family)
MPLTREQLLQSAGELRKEKGYIDVVSLARNNGIEVVHTSRPLENFNAQITYNKEDAKYTMYVNSDHSLERQRFSIAHELAHMVLHNTELQTLGKLNRSGSSQMEEEADELAAEILMPEDGVREYLNAMRTDTDSINVSVIKRLAEQFRVSKAVAIIRLRELDYYVPFIQLA